MAEPSRAEKMKSEIQDKVKKLIQEFSEGKISSEQFDLIYARYNNQLALAEQSLYGEEYESPVNTIAILDATKGKAKPGEAYAAILRSEWRIAFEL